MHGQMMDGLGLAETTPGPLILVTEFVGYLSAYRNGWGARTTHRSARRGRGAVGDVRALLPVDLRRRALHRMDHNQPRLKGALTAITAAVVGVILNLAIWFALHVFFAKVTLIEFGPLKLWTPTLSSLDWRVVVLSAMSGISASETALEHSFRVGSCLDTRPRHPVFRDLIDVPHGRPSRGASLMRYRLYRKIGLYCVCRALALTTAVVGVPVPTVLAVDGTSPPLVLEATIPLEGVAGRIDHMAIDLDKRRLVVAELGNNTVDVIDLETRRAIGRIKGLHEPQGVADAGGIITVANGGDGSVAFFRASDLAPLGSTNLGEDADNVRVDAHTGRVLVGYGHGALAVIDPVTRLKVADVPLAAHPEGFQITRDGSRAFVNVPDAEPDRSRRGWSSDCLVVGPPPRSNFPLALDATETTIAVVFRSPPRLVSLDAQSGAIRANVATCSDADDVFFDAALNRIYVNCGAGVVDVFDRRRGEPRRLTRVETSPGARTALFVPELDRLFVAARSGSFGGDAKIFLSSAQNHEDLRDAAFKQVSSCGLRSSHHGRRPPGPGPPQRPTAR